MAARHKYRLKCQTINKQNKLPCKAKGFQMKNGNIHCRLHGGFSTGPRTPKGKEKSLKNLLQFKNKDDTEIRTYIRNRVGHHSTVDEWNTSYYNLQSQE